MTNKDIKIEKVKYKKPKPEEMCKVYDLGNGVIEIETPKVRNKPYKNHCRRINKNEMVTEDGEIIEINHSNNRAENIQLFRKGIKYTYRLLMTNFSGTDSEKIVVLVCELNNDKELKTLYKDFGNFYGKLKRRIKKDLAYIIITLFIDKEKVIYEVWVKTLDNSPLVIENEMLQNIWNYGIAYTSNITDIRYQANYMEYTNGLKYYPAYCKFYRKSKAGITKPKHKIVPHAEAMTLVKSKNMEMTYGNTKIVTKATENGIEYAVNSITYEVYIDKKYIKKRGEKTMQDYITENKKKATEILEKIEKSSNYQDVADWIKLDYVAKDLNWLLVKTNTMTEYGSDVEKVQELINANISKTIANITTHNNFNLYETSSFKAIKLMTDTFEHIKEMFGQVSWTEKDRQKIENMFDLAISTIKSTDIYIESQTPKDIEED